MAGGLLVIYRIGEKRYAKALECKYQSKQGTYEDVIGVKIKMQYFIQECVMSFLFGKNEKLSEEKLPKKPKRGTLATKMGTRWLPLLLTPETAVPTPIKLRGGRLRQGERI